MAKPSRNEPCPCGSGKKYKRCCADSASVVIEAPAFGKAESNRAIALLHQLTRAPAFGEARAAAEAELFGNALESATEDQVRLAFENEQTMIAASLWIVLDAHVPAIGGRFVDVALHSALRKDLTSGQLLFLERMRASHLRPYEVREVRYDRGFTLKDLWSDVEVEVSERSATHYLERGAMMFARVIEGPRGLTEFHGEILVLRPTEMQDLLEHLRASFRAKKRKRAGLTEAEFFKEAGPRINQTWLARFAWKMPRLTTSDGEPLQMQDAIYDVVDRAALVRALNACEEFESDDDGNEYVWIRRSSKVAGMPNTLLGSVELQGSRMRVNLMSAERAERLRSLLANIAPGAVRYRLSELHDLSKLSGEEPAQGPSEETDSEFRDVKNQWFESYYRSWLDEAIPMLGGRTPRHAARLKGQRQKLAALLREIEGHAKGSDASFLWEELGLNELR